MLATYLRGRGLICSVSKGDQSYKLVRKPHGEIGRRDGQSPEEIHMTSKHERYVLATLLSDQGNII